MKSLAFLAVSLVLALWISLALSTKPASIGQLPARPANDLAVSEPGGKTGVSPLAGFADVWSRWQGGASVPELEEQVGPAPGPQQLMRDRIARFRAAQASRFSSPAHSLRPGDRAGQRDGDRVLTAGAAGVSTEEAVASRMRAEQMAERIQRFRLAQAQRSAQAGTEEFAPNARPAMTAGLRPGDKVGARAGDLASLQRRHP